MAENDDLKKDVVAQSEAEPTAQDSSPQSEEPTTEVQGTQETQVEPEKTTEKVSEDAMDEEQRKAFQDMRLKIKKLEDEKKARLKGENAFDVFRPKPQANVDINSYVDPVSGNVDWNAYNQAVITNAQAAASRTVQEQLDEQNARSKYPEAFEKFERAIAGEWLSAQLKGKPVSVTELAESYSQMLQADTVKVEKQAEKRGAEQALTQLTPKEQASLQAQGTTSQPARQAQSAEDVENLRIKTRYGDNDALANLMSRVPYVNK